MRFSRTRLSDVLHCKACAFATDLGVSVTTIKRWLSVLEAGRIIFILPPHFNNLGKRITKMPKIYFHDTGLACHLAGVHDREHLLEGPMAGALFENFCLQETVKCFANRGEQPRLSYLRTNNGLEVDLLIELRNMRILPVEIKLCLADGERPLCLGVNAIGVEEYLRRLRELLGA